MVLCGGAELVNKHHDKQDFLILGEQKGAADEKLPKMQ